MDKSLESESESESERITEKEEAEAEEEENTLQIKDNFIKRKNILFYSSFIFITNICTAFYNEYYLYSFFFFMLTITSLLYHYPSNNMIINILDRGFVLSIVVYGGILVYYKNGSENYFYYTSFIIAAFLFVIYTYIVGYLKNKYCFHPQICTADKYHCVIHIASCIAHHIIIFL